MSNFSFRWNARLPGWEDQFDWVASSASWSGQITGEPTQIRVVMSAVGADAHDVLRFDPTPELLLVHTSADDCSSDSSNRPGDF